MECEDMFYDFIEESFFTLVGGDVMLRRTLFDDKRNRRNSIADVYRKISTRLQKFIRIFRFSDIYDVDIDGIIL